MHQAHVFLAAALLGAATISPPAASEEAPEPSSAPTLQQEQTPPPEVRLEGETWQLVSYRTSDGLKTVLAQARPARFVFQDGRLSGSTGCNRLTGTYEIDGSVLTLGEGLALTKMGCPSPVMEQERAVVQAIQQVKTAERTGSALELRDAQGQVLLRFRLPGTPPLGSRAWRLNAYDTGKQALATPSTGANITLELKEEGRLGGFDGCNRYMSGYTLEGDELDIGPIATTRMACRGGKTLAQQARDYAAVLGRVASYRLEPSRLTLLDAAGRTVAVFDAEVPTPAQETL